MHKSFFSILIQGKQAIINILKKEWLYSKTIWKQFSNKQIHKNKCMSINTKIVV